MTSQLRSRIDRLLGRLTFWRGVFIVIMVVALYAAIVRFAQGLGAATHSQPGRRLAQPASGGYGRYGDP